MNRKLCTIVTKFCVFLFTENCALLFTDYMEPIAILPIRKSKRELVEQSTNIHVFSIKLNYFNTTATMIFW